MFKFSFKKVKLGFMLSWVRDILAFFLRILLTFSRVTPYICSISKRLVKLGNTPKVSHLRAGGRSTERHMGTE